MIKLNHTQRQTVERFWRAERIEWLEQECSLALEAATSPLCDTRKDRKEMKAEAAKLSEKIQAAINQLEALELRAGRAADVLTVCASRAPDVRQSLAQSRDFAWQLENQLEQLGASRKPEERTTLMIRKIALELRADGIEPIEAEGGALNQIAALALSFIGKEPKDMRGTIRQVISRSPFR
jgi:hypothetical protein